MTPFSAIVRRSALILMIVGLVAATGCSSKKTKEGDGAVPNAAAADERSH